VKAQTPDVPQFSVGFLVVIFGRDVKQTDTKQSANFATRILSALMELAAENMQPLRNLPEKFLRLGCQIQINGRVRSLSAQAANLCFSFGLSTNQYRAKTSS
jgi:hypothetical protein